MSAFLYDFPWGDYCFRSRDPSSVATYVTEIMTAGMDAYIPSSIKSFSPSNPWFDRACSLAIQAREHAYQSYQNSPSAASHSAFISARNRCKTIIRRAKHSFVKKKCDNLTASPSNNSFWSLAKNVSNNFCNSSFPPLFRPDGSIACSPTEKATLFGSLFSTNSSLDDSDAPLPSNLPLSHPMPPPPPPYYFST